MRTGTTDVLERKGGRLSSPNYQNSIPFNNHIKPEVSPYNSVRDDIRSRLKKHPSFKYWKAIHDQHLLLVLQNLHLAYQMSPDTYVAYSRNKNDYSKPDAGKAPFKVAYGAMMRVVDGLTDLGFVEGKKGFFYDVDTPGTPLLAYIARMRATPELSQLLPGAHEAKLRMAPKDKGLIVLRNAEKEDTPFTEDDETQRMRENLRTINSANQLHFIALCVLDEEFERVFKEMNGDRNCGQASTDMFFGHTDIYRVFSNSTFEEGGRFYGGWWENLPSDFRQFIRIDNYMVVELDYSCLHPTLLYLEDRLSVPDGDLYEVPGFPPEARKFLKAALNIIVNAKDRTAAKKAIRRMYTKQEQDTRKGKKKKKKELPPLPQGMTLDQIFDGFSTKHHPIMHHFFTAGGRRLQRIDSDIAEQVMLRLVGREIAILPLHDSFLVSRLHEDDLAATMDAVVSERYGKEIKIKMDPTAWGFIYDIGAEDEYDHNIERWEREPFGIMKGRFSEYNRQYTRFKESQGVYSLPG